MNTTLIEAVRGQVVGRTRAEATVAVAQWAKASRREFSVVLDLLNSLLADESGLFRREDAPAVQRPILPHPARIALPRKTRRRLIDAGRQPYIPDHAYVPALSAQVMRSWQVKPGAKELLVLLVGRGGASREVIAATWWIANELGCTRRCVQLWRQHLVGLGLIEHRVLPNQDVLYTLSPELLAMPLAAKKARAAGDRSAGSPHDSRYPRFPQRPVRRLSPPPLRRERKINVLAGGGGAKNGSWNPVQEERRESPGKERMPSARQERLLREENCGWLRPT